MSDSGFTLLVVDDNQFVVRTMSRHLEDEGYQVIAARDGEAALRVVNEEPIDLIVLDVNMPGVDGVEVLRTVRQRFTPDQLPVIMATANGRSDDVVQQFPEIKISDD